MKRILFALLAFAVSTVSSFGQTGQSYALAKEGATVRYSFKYGEKLAAYADVTVTKNEKDGTKETVTTLWTMLNKKGKPSKTASLIGAGKGIMYNIKLDNGSYYLTTDLIFGGGGIERSGYLLKMPGELKQGDEIEGGTLRLTHKFMGRKTHNVITCSGFKVTGEAEVKTETGTIKCLAITGKVSGEFQTVKIDETQTWLIAPGIGIVKQESKYLDEKRPCVAEVCQTSGL